MTITGDIERALVGLRLERELNLSVPESREALARVSDDADRALELDDYREIPQKVLPDLAGAAALRAEDAERVLEDVLRGLGIPSPGPSEELEFIEEAPSGGLARAAATARFEDARPEFSAVTALVGAAVRVSMRSGIPLATWVENLVRDFDHVDEPGVLGGIHADLRAGTYQGRPGREVPDGEPR